MIDPSKLKAGQRIELKQDKKGEWQEWLIDKDNNIVAVEDIKPFEKSKLEQATPHNYEELKKNYVYLSKKEELSPPISIFDPLEPLDNNELEPPEIDVPDDEDEEPEEVAEKEPDPEADRDIDQEIKEQEKERDCEVKEKEN